MSDRHIVELLIEANKKIGKTIDQLENESAATSERQHVIDDLNDIIRDLDHVVENLGKK